MTRITPPKPKSFSFTIVFPDTSFTHCADFLFLRRRTSLSFQNRGEAIYYYALTQPAWYTSLPSTVTQPQYLYYSCGTGKHSLTYINSSSICSILNRSSCSSINTCKAAKLVGREFKIINFSILVSLYSPINPKNLVTVSSFWYCI